MGPEKAGPFGQGRPPKGKFGGGGGGARKRPAEMYQNKKQLELQMRKEKREIGIKGRYKKLLRKENHEGGKLNQGKKNSDDRVPNLESQDVGAESSQSSREFKPKENDTKETKWTGDKERNWTRDKERNWTGDKERNWTGDKERKWTGDQKNFKTRGPHGKPTALKKAKNIFEQRRQDREWKASEKKRQDEERNEAIVNRKKKRLAKFKVLNQKTPKGQPLMKGRIQMLLQKIQSGMT